MVLRSEAAVVGRSYSFEGVQMEVGLREGQLRVN